MLRLLSLPDEVKKELIYGRITPSHARNLVGLSDDEAGMLLNTISGEKLNVRETERKVRELKSKIKDKKSKKDLSVSYQIKDYEEELLEKLQTKVKINYKAKGRELKGRIEIEFYSGEELERIIEFINKN